MFGGARMHGPWWLTGASHVVILMIAAKLESRAVWPWALLAMAGVSFVAWIGNYRRYRQIHDLPTSKIVSAAQGYVELLGRSEPVKDHPVWSALSKTPCCWYSYQIEEQKNNDKWEIIEKGRSVDHFLLIDDTGECVVSPDGAEVFSRQHKSWREGRYRYNEWLLMPNHVLYALGEFTTMSGHVAGHAEEREQIRQLIADWKADQKNMLERFDLNRDGQIDMKEWELARLQAVREVRKQRAEQAGKKVEGVHLLRKPKDRRLFLLANEMPDKLGRRYWWWSLVHLVAIAGFGIGALVLLGYK